MDGVVSPHAMMRLRQPVVTVPHLSFATDLLFNLDEVRSACTKGLATQNNLVALLKSRVALERHYANELSRMTQQSPLEELEHGTMREALGKLKAQYLNTSVQHRMLANNLEEDVLRPIEALYTYNAQKAQNLNKLVNNIKKQAKVHEDAYKKDYQLFDKQFHEASTQFAFAMDAGFSSTEIEHQYLVQLAQLDNGVDDNEQMEMIMMAGNPSGSGSRLTNGEARPRQMSAATIQSINNNSQKLVNWLLASDQQRKENVYIKAVQMLEAAEVARRKCMQSWESVEQSRLEMYRTLQSVLTEYQQVAEHRISNLATNLRKHVVFESSALANEQYDWQMIASKIENVDFEGDIREFILDNFSHDLETMTVNDLCHVAATSSLVVSPSSKPCRPLKQSPLQIKDLALRKIPVDHQGNRDPLPSVLVTRATAVVPKARAPTTALETKATEPTAPDSSTASSAAASSHSRRLTIQIPSPKKPDFRDVTQYRVCLAQDVAHAIARAYELRSLQKHSLQSPLSYEANLPGREPENNGSDVLGLKLEIYAVGSTASASEANDRLRGEAESPQHSECDQEDPSKPEKAKHPAPDEPAQPSQRLEPSQVAAYKEHTAHTCCATDTFVGVQFAMEDYIQGVVCGYLTVQSGMRDDTKRKRMFVVLSDSRMDYYLTDPRPAFDERITESYVFTDKTQVHHYAEMNPRAPLYSLCLTTDRATDVYLAESAREAEVWLQHLQERLKALHEVVVGTLMVRKELSVAQQVQRMLLQTKYTWRPKHAELGRSTLRYCSTQAGRQQKHAMNQFTLTAESYASEEPVELLKSVALAGFAMSAGALSAAELRKIQRDVKLRAALSTGKGTSGLVFPFVVCTGPAHFHLAAATEIEREEWIIAIKLRIIALKYRHNGRPPAKCLQQTISTGGGGSSNGVGVRMHDFMEVQFMPGGPWRRRYVELENEMLKVKLNDRTLGSKFETRLLPSCGVAPSLLNANAFSVQNLAQEISLAPGTLQDAQRWVSAINDVSSSVSWERSAKVFHDELAVLLAHSVVYNVTVAGGSASAAGFVVEKYKKRIFVVSHQSMQADAAASTQARQQTPLKLPEGSVLLGISHVGMVHDSFETIWHKLRQKKSFPTAMRLTFRLPLYKEALVDVKFRSNESWALRRCVLHNGKFRVEPALPPAETSEGAVTGSDHCAQPTPLEVALRNCRVELLPTDALGVRNTLKISVASANRSQPKVILLLRVHHDRDLFVWFALLLLECGVAQDDPTFPLSMKTLKKLKQGTPSPLGYVEDQKKRTAKCKIAGRLLVETEQAAKALEPKLLQRARVEQQQLLREDQLLLAQESPISPGQIDMSLAFVGRATATLSDEDVKLLFQDLDVIGCGRISSSAVATTIESLSRQLDATDRDRILEPVRLALSTLVPASRQYASITLEQTTSVLRHVTDPRVVELVRKLSRHEVQCI